MKSLGTIVSVGLVAATVGACSQTTPFRIEYRTTIDPIECLARDSNSHYGGPNFKVTEEKWGFISDVPIYRSDLREYTTPCDYPWNHGQSLSNGGAFLF